MTGKKCLNSRKMADRTEFVLVLSFVAFYTCPDECTSTLPQHCGQEASDGISLRFLNFRFTFRSN